MRAAAILMAILAIGTASSATAAALDRCRANLDVLVYNIEGLQWPARRGRAKSLAQIGEHLRELRSTGKAPDVVLFQEAFSPAAINAVRRTGYAEIVRGPSRTARSVYKAGTKLPGRKKPLKGEVGVRLLSSGLIIASRYPVLETASDAFSRLSCAGFDCLSNKGVLLARVSVLGVPEPIDIVTTYMNARGASKVSTKRNLAAHQAQAREIADFLKNESRADRAMIFGGDFNMRRSPERYDAFRTRNPLRLVHEHCLRVSTCQIGLSWDGDQPWMDTQDLQFFASGEHLRVTPLKVNAMFDGSPGSPRLSDHDGFRVVYRLEWTGKATGQPRSGSCG